MTSSLWYYVGRAISRLTLGYCRLLAIAFYAQPVHDKSLVREDHPEGLVVGVLQPNSVPEERFGRPTGAIAERFRAGHTCIAASRGSALLGFLWITTQPLAERLVRCIFEPYPPSVAWDYDLFIAPRYRLGRTFARLWSAANEYLWARGVRATVSWVELSNVAAMRAHARLGAERVGWAIFLTFGKAQLSLCSMPPYLHWSSPDGQPVRLRVTAAPALQRWKAGNVA